MPFLTLKPKIKKLQFLIIFILLKRMTNLNSEKDEGNRNSCRPQPPMFHSQLDDFSITPLWKPPIYSATSSHAYEEFKLELPHKRGYP